MDPRRPGRGRRWASWGGGLRCVRAAWGSPWFFGSSLLATSELFFEVASDSRSAKRIALDQGSPVRNWAARQEVRAWPTSEASSVFTGAPQCLPPWAPLPVRGGIRVLQEHEPNLSSTYPETIPPVPVHGKTVFRKTCVWYQKGWGALL